jgi:hypothetical protein
VQTEMRKAAMKLHTREQAPKEGQQKSGTPMKQWAPTRAGECMRLLAACCLLHAVCCLLPAACCSLLAARCLSSLPKLAA